MRWEMQAVVADAVRNIQPRGLPPLATAAAASALRQRYVNVSLDSMYGGPSICAMLPQSTPSSLNRAYVLALLEGAIGDKVTSSDVIVEFGGGSGFLAASLFAADPDFTGLYVIWDLPLDTSEPWFRRSLSYGKTQFLESLMNW